MTRIISLFLLSLVVLSSCDKNNPNNAEPTIKELITSGVWLIDHVDIDGVDYTSSFEGMTLKVGEGYYESTNGNYPWLDTDTWDFIDDTYRLVIRGDGIEVQVINISAKNLTLGLIWNDPVYTIGGRESSVLGEHVFLFKKSN